MESWARRNKESLIHLFLSSFIIIEKMGNGFLHQLLAGRKDEEDIASQPLHPRPIILSFFLGRGTNKKMSSLLPRQYDSFRRGGRPGQTTQEC